MDLPYGNYISHQKVTPILDVGNNYPFSTAYYCDYYGGKRCSKQHSGRKYIYDGYQIILTNSDKALINVPLQEPTFREPIH